MKKAAAPVFEANSLLELPPDAPADPFPRHRSGLTALRTLRALEETHTMLEQAALAIQRAHALFLPAGLTRSPF